MNKNVHILYAECMDASNGLNKSSIDLIYLDPPFNLGRKVKDVNSGMSFDDVFTASSLTQKEYLSLCEHKHLNTLVEALAHADKRIKYYLLYMALRVYSLIPLLKETGSLVYHCDLHASHYVKVLLDFIMGTDAFKNEIVWWYRKMTNAKKNLGKNHDVLLWYGKDPDKTKFNIQYVDFSPRTQKDKYARTMKDGKWTVDKSVPMESVRTHEGVPLLNTWEVSAIRAKSNERVDYPTQKPKELLKLLIRALTDEGDAVLDPFCGSGTTGVACVETNRKAVLLDKSRDASTLARGRVKKAVIEAAGRYRNYDNGNSTE